MNHVHNVAITGVGYAVGPVVRGNDDPIFDWLKAHPQPGQDLFKGYKERRVLPAVTKPGDPVLADLMTTAVQQALTRAGMLAEEVDAILGFASVGEYITPNPLSKVHCNLGLRADSWLLPTEGEEHFNWALVVANSMVRSGQLRNAVVVSGCNWTNFVSYQTPQSVAVSDGAGAIVLAKVKDSRRFSLIDAATQSLTAGYGCMYMAGDAATTSTGITYGSPYFHITAAGNQQFLEFGAKIPPVLANRVLARNGLAASDVTLISHQSSRVLLDAWKTAIEPGQYIDTLEKYADMVGACVPVNLACHYDKIEKDYLLLLDVSAELKTTALLLQRQRK